MKANNGVCGAQFCVLTKLPYASGEQNIQIDFWMKEFWIHSSILRLVQITRSIVRLTRFEEVRRQKLSFTCSN